MGQLRGAVSALARAGDPARILERLDAFVETVPSAATATLAYVELDPGTGDVRYACAGHPPPLVVSPDGRTRFLWDGRSPPLGSLLGQDRDAAVDRLEEGETLVLYTDGLVERRSASIDVGLERLADAARRSAIGAARLADEICDALLDGPSQDDDVCVLTLFRIPSVKMFSHTFPAAPAELAGLRERLRLWLELCAVPENVERGVVLAVSEAAANAVEHGYRCDGAGLVTVMARHADDRLEITVRDEGTWNEGSRTTDRGRGLQIIRAIVEELSIGQEEGATVLRMRTGAKESAVA
jgi:serine/threonine-protein kinase RsbW